MTIPPACTRLGALMLFLCASQMSPATPLGREVIEAHRDRNIQVAGRFAAVKLPLDHGVKLWNPTAIARGPGGTMFAANFTGEIYTLRDTNGDGLEDTAQPFADVRQDGLRYPTSIAFLRNDLYVATTQEIRIYTDTDGDGVADQSRTFFKGFPHTLHRFDWTFGLCFGPDGWLYFILSTDAYNPAPAPDPGRWRGAMLRVSPDGAQVERYATGLRFAYGAAFNQLGDLFFTDNRGGENTSEELNLSLPGRFYGHNPQKYPDPSPTTDPTVRIELGVAAAGICFNRGDNAFGGTAGDLFVACWGPDFLFDRGSIIRINLFKLPDGSYRGREYPFAHEVPKTSGVAFGPQGDLYATLFGQESRGHLPSPTPTGAVYRFVPADWIAPGSQIEMKHPLVKGDPESGRKLFSERGCVNCHAMSSGEMMLGPDLAGLGEIYSVAEMRQLIFKPSDGIKSGFETEEIVLKNGDVLRGRMLTSSPESITLVTVGNQRVPVPRGDIVSERLLATSLMPEGLLAGLGQRQINDLLAYLGVRDRSPGWLIEQLLRIEEASRPIFPYFRFRAKLVAVGCLAATLAGTILLMRRRSRKTRGRQL